MREYKDGDYSIDGGKEGCAEAPAEEHRWHPVVLAEELVLVATQRAWAVHRLHRIIGAEGRVQEEGAQVAEGQGAWSVHPPDP